MIDLIKIINVNIAILTLTNDDESYKLSLIIQPLRPYDVNSCFISH